MFRLRLPLLLVVVLAFVARIDVGFGADTDQVCANPDACGSEATDDAVRLVTAEELST